MNWPHFSQFNASQRNKVTSRLNHSEIHYLCNVVLCKLPHLRIINDTDWIIFTCIKSYSLILTVIHQKVYRELYDYYRNNYLEYRIEDLENIWKCLVEIEPRLDIKLIGAITIQKKWKKIYIKMNISAIKIQAAFRSWRIRKNVIWNLHTELGKRFLELKIANDIKNDI